MLPAIEAARASGDWNALVLRVPYMRFLGVSCEEKDGVLLGRMKFAEHLIGNPTIPALHGGTLGALLEGAAQFELLYRARTAVLPKTITLTIDYLRSGKPQDVWVRAQIVKLGKRVCSVRSEAWQDDASKPIAAANVHLLIL